MPALLNRFSVNPQLGNDVSDLNVCGQNILRSGAHIALGR